MQIHPLPQLNSSSINHSSNENDLASCTQRMMSLTKFIKKDSSNRCQSQEHGSSSSNLLWCCASAQQGSQRPHGKPCILSCRPSSSHPSEIRSKTASKLTDSRANLSPLKHLDMQQQKTMHQRRRVQNISSLECSLQIDASEFTDKSNHFTTNIGQPDQH